MFGLSKRAITILFGLLALAFALGAILLFTPQAAQQTRVAWQRDRQPASRLRRDPGSVRCATHRADNSTDGCGLR